jgi:DNA-binding SARP family transcriptional activator
LAELLWPDVPLPEARHSLATALSILRPRLGPGAIEATRDQVVLVEGCVSMDLDRLLSGEIMATATQGSLEVAGFLEGFDIPDAAEYGLWKDRQRARLLPAIRAALVQLIDRCRRTADSRQIEHLADTMLALDDLSEEAVRAKMEARAFAGDRLTALRIFEEWKERLAEAVGAQPSEMVEGMAIRLRRRGWERTNLAAIPTVRTEQWRDRSFVGRSAEYRLLYEAWEKTRNGTASHALILGDSGVGKSTLVDRLLTAAGLEGAISSRAQCYDLEQGIPYAVVSTLVHGLLDRPGVSATPPEALAEIALTITEVRQKFPSIPVVSESHGETARLKLTEALYQMLITLSEEHPVILVVDDLHLCDEASLSVLHLVSRRVGAKAIMIMLVGRPGELSRSPPALQLRTHAQSLGFQELELLPLSANESMHLLIALLGPFDTRLDVALRRAMIRLAGGYPMILELLVQDWRANGDRSLALGLDAMTVDFGTSADAPPVYKQFLDRLLVVLDHSTRQVLNVAAVLGHRLNDIALYSIADLGRGQVMAAMAELVRHRVLRDAGTGLEFVNEFLRAAAYLEVPSVVRRALHSTIAEHLMAEEQRGVRFLGLEIAWHATRAGRVAEVPVFLLKGCREAVAQGALDSAARALSTALPQLDAKDQCAAALLLAEVLQEQGRWTDSAAVLSDHRAAQSTAIGRIFLILAEHRTVDSTGDQLIADTQQLLSILRSDPSQSARLRAASAAAQLMGDIRDQALSRALLSAIVAGISRHNLAEHDRHQLDLCRAQFLYYAGQQGEVFHALAELARSLRTDGAVNSTLGRVYAGLGAVRCYEGKYEEAKSEFATGHELAIRIANESMQGAMAANLALCCLRLGEYSELQEWAAKATLIAQPNYLSKQVAYFHAYGMAMCGDTAGALRVFESLDSRDHEDTPLWLGQARKLHRADILCLCGHRAAALNQAKEAISSRQPVLYAPSFAGAFARWLSMISLQDGTLNKARPILEDLGKRSQEFDAFDRAEITCARLIAVRDGDASGELAILLGKHLANLPPAVADQLGRLGVLSGR